MELSCESVRYAEDSRRPATCKFVELHVLHVPSDQWNEKLNKVPAEATKNFISAGFIRVYPDITLKTLRSELCALLGTERSVNKYSFLKCVGQSLALVKSKQERDLKVKLFAPPYAVHPELYLLPTAETDSSFFSQSFTLDTTSSSPDEQIYYPPPKMCSLPTGTKEPVKFPHIPQCSQQPPPTSWLEEEEEEEQEEDEEDNQSCSSSEEENEEESLGSIRRAEKERSFEKPQNYRALQLDSLKKALGRCEDDSAQMKWLQNRKETCKKKKQCQRDRHPGAAEPLEDGDSVFSLTDWAGKSKGAHTLKSIRAKAMAGVEEHPCASSWPVWCISPHPDLDLVTVPNKTATTSPVFQRNREALLEKIKLMREERKQLEGTRQELLRKGKHLLAQNRHRRNQARDRWKKKYFEAKKATAPLEENLRSLTQELETFYNKLMHQLQARENRGKPRRARCSSLKNELIIQIMKESYEIDNLRRKVEDTRMKLTAEIKLRKQAATELRALKAELAQKKSQSSHGPLHTDHRITAAPSKI